MFDFIEKLREELPRFQNVLELGSKKGENLELLNGYYEVVASEDEKVKTRYLKDEFIDIRVILIDKIELDTHKRFDCVFSNKTFDDCSFEQIKESFSNQKNILNKDGIIFHIFDNKRVNKEEILSSLDKNYKLLQSEDVEDIFYILARAL